MTSQILTAARIPHEKARYPDPPAGTYAIHFDDIEVDGPDHLEAGAPWVAHHDCTIELYEPAPDPAVEAALEAQLTAQGVAWTKQDRYWLDNIKRYQVIYEFSYITKS